MKISKKCKFIFEGKKYFYLSKFSEELKTPELYLVHWNEAKENIINLEYPLKELQKETMILRSDEYSHLEFTLRSDEKVPQKLQNIECSPILHQEESISKSVENIEEPSSPRFKNQAHSPL